MALQKNRKVGRVQELQARIIKLWVRKYIASTDLQVNDRMRFSNAIDYLVEKAYPSEDVVICGVRVKMRYLTDYQDITNESLLRQLSANAALAALNPNMDLDRFIKDWLYTVPELVVAYNSALRRWRALCPNDRGAPDELRKLSSIASLVSKVSKIPGFKLLDLRV